MEGRILYHKPLEYFECFGGYKDFDIFEPTFEFYWKSFKNNLPYYNFFKPNCEIKHKPSIFLYIQLQELSKLYDVYNQPINRMLNWNYFDIKYKENFNNFKEDEKLIINRNLSYFKQVDN